MPRLPIDPYAYAREFLLPPLGLQNHPFVIHLPEPGGLASHVVKVTIERAPALLVRFFKGRARARRSALALRHLGRLGLPAPRLMFDDTGLANPLLRRNGLPRYATAETWIEGVRALEAEGEEEVVEMVARVLARYHAFTRSRWGRPAGPLEVRPYHMVTLTRVSRMTRDMVARGVLEPEEAAEARARFGAWKRTLRRQETFHLVHNDASRSNFIVSDSTEKRSIIPIDVQRVSYEPCSEELANAIYHFCRNEASLAERFLTAYLEAAVPSCRETWRQTGTFFTALNNLKRLHRRTGPSAGADPLTGSDPRTTEWKQTITSLSPPAPA
jgi:hypothetical protein